MTPSYNEREVLALLQEESTTKAGIEMIVAQYSRAAVLADSSYGPLS